MESVANVWKKKNVETQKRPGAALTHNSRHTAQDECRVEWTTRVGDVSGDLTSQSKTAAPPEPQPPLVGAPPTA